MGCCCSSSAAKAARDAELASRPPAPGAAATGAAKAAASDASPSTATPRAVDCRTEPSASDLDGSTFEPLEDATGEGALAQAEGVLRACRARLDLGDVPGAERALVTALRRLQAEGAAKAVDIVRASAEYAETLAEVRFMEEAAKDVLGEDQGSGEWLFGCDVKVDHKSLGLELDEETAKHLIPDGKVFKIYYRLNGKKCEVKLNGIFATHPGPRVGAVGGVCAMYHETQLWHTWHPLVMGKGPTECWKRRPCHNLWQVPTKVFMVRECELVEERMHLIEDEGVMLLTLDSSYASDLWDIFPPPSGHRKMPTTNKTRIAMIAQKHTTFFTVCISAQGESKIPGFLVKFLVSWVVPEVVRRIIRAGLAACKADGPHVPVTAADAEGVYAAARRVTERGKEIDELSSRKQYKPQDLPSPDVILGRRTSLLAWEQAFPLDRSCAALQASSSDSPAAADAYSVAVPGDCPAPAESALQALPAASKEQLEEDARVAEAGMPRLRSPDSDDRVPAEMSNGEQEGAESADRAAGGCLFC